jgi:glutathione S-transferase
MQLYYSPTSPFARKVHMLALALELPQLELLRTNPLTDDQFRQINPLGKIPALLDGDLLLVNSPLICEYLQEKALTLHRQDFYQRSSPEYYSHQMMHTLADGIMESAVAIVFEKRRQDAPPSPFWLQRWFTSINMSLNCLTVDALGTAQTPHIGSFAVIAALEYLDFRHPDIVWRTAHPKLAQWHLSMSVLPWVTSTRPKDT